MPRRFVVAGRVLETSYLVPTFFLKIKLDAR